MGFIKSGLVIFLSVVLFLVLFLGNMFLTLSWSLEYETVSPLLMSSNNSGGDNLGINSSTIQIYYQERDCSFWKCLKTESGASVLVSETARVYWNSLFYWAILIAGIIFALLFLFTDKKNSSLTIVGVLMILAALPFKKLAWVLSFIPNSSLSDLGIVFFSKSYNVFLIMIVIGFSLLVIGLALHFFTWGMKLSDFVSELFKKKEKNDEPILEDGEKEILTKEEVKDLVKEEVDNSKKKEGLRNHVKKLVKDEIDKMKDKKIINFF